MFNIHDLYHTLLLLYLCVYMSVCARLIVCVEVRGQYVGLVLAFCCVGSGN